MNFKSSWAVLWSFPSCAQLCHVEQSSNKQVWTQHLWADRQGGNGGKLRLRYCLSTNKRCSERPNGVNHLPQFRNPASTNHPHHPHPPSSHLPFPLLAFDLPFQFRMDGNVTRQKEKERKRGRNWGRWYSADSRPKHCCSSVSNVENNCGMKWWIYTRIFTVWFRLPFSQCLPSRPIGHSHL